MTAENNATSGNIKTVTGNAVCPKPGSEDRYIYRVLRPDESCQTGIIARAPAAALSIIQHVGCGANVAYRSQYISFTSSIERARFWAAKAPITAKVAQVQLDNAIVKKNCRITDLTTEASRRSVLRGAFWAQAVAENSCEVVLQCGNNRLPCNVV